jgi:Domain of unknown function (DUF4188)
MARVIADRLTAQVDGEVVVFLIGMRINRIWKIHKWLPVALAIHLRAVEAGTKLAQFAMKHHKKKER